MMQCIYCRNNLVAGATDGTQPSLEHIVQYAIGGSDGLATRDVCNRCNSNLGDTIDARFIHNPLIGMARLQHDLEGHGGRVSDVTLNASTTKSGRAAEVRLTRDGGVEFRHRPQVDREKRADGSEAIRVGGARDAARKIAQGLLAKADKSGSAMWTASGKRVTSVDELLEEAEIETFDSYKAEMSISLTDIYAGVVKIAFGFAHVTLGPDWTFGPTAERLRKIARGHGSAAETKSVLKGANKRLRSLFRDLTAGDTSHVIGLVTGESAVILVSLFGGESMTFAVDVGPMMDPLNPDHMGAIIELSTRKTTWIGLAEVANRLHSGKF